MLSMDTRRHAGQLLKYPQVIITGDMKMDLTPYTKLAEALNLRNMTLPSVPIEEFYKLVQELFTPEEAEIACAMPLGYSSIEQIAAKFPGISAAELATKLETMADKLVVEIRESNGKKSYELLPFIPGITELIFLSGLPDERSRNVFNLVTEYIHALERMAPPAPQPQAAPAEPARKVSVEEEVTHKSAVVPLKEISELLMNAETIGAGICVCRRQGDLNNNPCKAPQNNCLILGDSAKFAIGRGVAKLITKEDAVKRMEEADKAGLIHSYSNDTDHFINLLCNCCQCHCTIIQAVKRAPVPGEIITARYLVEIDEDGCTACEACIERCQMEALTIKDGKLSCNAIRCLGCGLCTSVCPTESLTLKPLEASKIPLAKG
jgi:Na+-translocating ferredoxin:NAD+ oxidoreductase subunit B